MDLETSRSKQRAAQVQAQTQPDGVARIGDRDPETGRYSVQYPDGGIGANGIKTYTAASTPGDIVVMFPRSDGSVALDSEKGSPTIVPDVFNKPVPEVKKPKVWILYFFEGKLWVGGHQEKPEEAGSVSLYGYDRPPIVPESDGGPIVLGYNSTSDLHVWGDSVGWHVTYQTFPYPNQDYNSSVTFHSVTAASHEKYSTAFSFDLTGGSGGNNQHENNDRSFPLGAGFVSYRSSRLMSFISPDIIYDSTVYQTASSVQQVTIGYMHNAVPTFTQFNSKSSFSSAIHVYLYRDEIISYSGTIPIPHINRPSDNPVTYSGIFSSPLEGDGRGPYFRGFNSANNIIYPVLNIQSTHNYPIMCDRYSTYYIQESVFTSGANTPVQRLYELKSTGSQTVISTNTIEPRFFGIRWDSRGGNYVEGAWASATSYRGYETYKLVDYSDQVYYYPDYFLEPNYHGERVFPIGHFKRVPDPMDPISSEFRTYPYIVTFSGGQVVTISLSEINKAKSGSAYLQRQAVGVDGKMSDLGTTFCYPIPAAAQIKHWSTTA